MPFSCLPCLSFMIRSLFGTRHSNPLRTERLVSFRHHSTANICPDEYLVKFNLICDCCDKWMGLRKGLSQAVTSFRMFTMGQPSWIKVLFVRWRFYLFFFSSAWTELLIFASLCEICILANDFEFQLRNSSDPGFSRSTDAKSNRETLLWVDKGFAWNATR
jgi:hypothetical protein